MILVKYIEILDVSCTVDEILELAKVSRLVETSTGSNQAQRIVKMSAGVVVEFGPWGSRLYSGFSVVESDIYCRIWCHMFVKTVRTVRLRYAFTQIVMIRSHFHCRNTVSKYWYFSETTPSFQLTSHPTQAAYGGWLETGDLTQVYTTKTTQITFFRSVKNRFWN